MDSKIAEQILDELAPTFEAIESRSDAILHFLKDKGIADDEQLAPYLEQAAAASNVRWRALRVRMGRLFAMAEKSDEERTAKETAKQVREEKTKVDQQVQASAKKTLEESAENHTGDAESEADSKQHDQKQQKQMERGEKPEVKGKGEPLTAAADTQQEKPPRSPTAGGDAKASSPKSGSKEETSSQKPASESSDKNAA